VQKDLLVNAARDKQACEIRTRGGATTQDNLYPEGHPKRIEQDSQQMMVILPRRRRSTKQLRNLMK
jgi:hypothetical protein